LTRRPSFAVNAATRGPERDRGWLCRSCAYQERGRRTVCRWWSQCRAAAV